jgi:hypothetical protein
MQRPERIVAIGLGGLLTAVARMIDRELEYWPLLVALGLIAVLANLTALERIYSVYRVAHGVPLDAPHAPTEDQKGTRT